MATTEVETEVAEERDPGTIFKVPVVKGKTYLEVKSGILPDHVYHEALLLGLKTLLNRGQTKITKEAFPEPEKLRAEAMEKAEETLENMYSGKIRVAGGKASGKVPGVVMTEARRIARALVKEELKRSGVRVSLVEASVITAAANGLIASQPEILEQATEEIERRAKTKIKIDISSIQISPKKLKAAEAKQAEKVLSAAKTGKIATRARPSVN
jgi:hypothetical protein